MWFLKRISVPVHKKILNRLLVQSLTVRESSIDVGHELKGILSGTYYFTKHYLQLSHRPVLGVEPKKYDEYFDQYKSVYDIIWHEKYVGIKIGSENLLEFQIKECYFEIERGLWYSTSGRLVSQEKLLYQQHAEFFNQVLKRIYDLHRLIKLAPQLRDFWRRDQSIADRFTRELYNEREKQLYGELLNSIENQIKVMGFREDIIPQYSELTVGQLHKDREKLAALEDFENETDLILRKPWYERWKVSLDSEFQGSSTQALRSGFALHGRFNASTREPGNIPTHNNTFG